MIPIFRPSMGDEEAQAVAEVLKSGWIGLGPKTAEFEKAFSKYLGVDYVVALNSCTAALDLALKLLNIQEGDEVIVPTMTFVSTAHAVVYNRAIPVFADVDPKTLCIDLEDVRRKITNKTKAVIAVHFGGRAADIGKLKEIAGNIPVIEDCAHAAGSSYQGKKCGSLGDIGCFSFHAVKNLAMGDGGALSLNNQELAERAKRLRWLGIDKGTWDREKEDKSYWWAYLVDEIGLKCHMNDINAAIGLVQLRKLDEMNKKRKELVKKYIEILKQSQKVEIPEYTEESSWHLFFIKCEERDKLGLLLKDKEISSGVHYKPIHQYQCYKSQQILPAAEAVFLKLLTLPLYPDLSIAKVEEIAGYVLEHVENKAENLAAAIPKAQNRKIASDKDILLISPPARWPLHRYSTGLLCVSAYLRKYGYDNKVVENKTLEDEGLPRLKKGDAETAPKFIFDYVVKVKPKIIGFTATTPEFFEVAELNKKIKEKMPEIWSVAGGPHATAKPEDFLNNGFDIVIIGEGEATMLALVQELEKNEPNLRNVQGIVFSVSSQRKLGSSNIKNEDWIPGQAWNDSDIITTDPRPLLDLSTLPMPAYDKIDMSRHTFMWDGVIRGIPLRCGIVMGSRGCYYDCSFCACNRVFGRNVRYFTEEQITNEIKFLRDNYNVEAIWFADDSLTVNREHILKICRIMKKIGMYWGAQSRVDLNDKDLIQTMKNSGCLQLDFGVESGSQRILDDIIEKRIKIEQVKATFKYCREVGIRTLAGFMIGLPTETKQDLRETYWLAKELQADHYGLSVCTPLPGTNLYDRFFADEMTMDDYKDLNFHREKFNKSEMTDLRKINLAWRKELFKGTKWKRITHPWIYFEVFWRLPHKKERLKFMAHKLGCLLKFVWQECLPF